MAYPNSRQIFDQLHRVRPHLRLFKTTLNSFTKFKMHIQVSIILSTMRRRSKLIAHLLMNIPLFYDASHKSILYTFILHSRLTTTAKTTPYAARHWCDVYPNKPKANGICMNMSPHYLFLNNLDFRNYITIIVFFILRALSKRLRIFRPSFGLFALDCI